MLSIKKKYIFFTAAFSQIVYWNCCTYILCRIQDSEDPLEDETAHYEGSQESLQD